MTPERILRELDELWVSLGKEPAEGGHGMMRACTMTLLVLASESDDPAGIWETLAGVMPRHPSRAVLIRLLDGGPRRVDARVFAQCWLPFGQRRQICCEQIEITATAASLPDVPAVVLPLAPGDLPLILYCRCAGMFGSPQFDALAKDASKVVVDSARFGVPASAIPMLASRLEAGRPVADLAWTRLTYWREAFAQLFEEPARRGLLPAATEVRIVTAGEALSPEVCYLAAWLVDGVGRAGGTARAVLERAQGGAAGGIRRVLVRGGALEAAVAIREDGCAEMRAGVVEQRAPLVHPSESTVLDEELAVPASDPVFARILPAAARLALAWRR